MKFTALLLLMLGGCVVGKPAWECAERLCAANGGVQYVWGGTTGVVCKNGAHFDDAESCKETK